MKQKAQFDYSLADLIGISVARVMSSDATFPAIYEVYPNLFEEEQPQETPQDQATTNSVNNFLAFAMAHNARMKEVEQANYDI